MAMVESCPGVLKRGLFGCDVSGSLLTSLFLFLFFVFCRNGQWGFFKESRDLSLGLSLSSSGFLGAFFLFFGYSILLKRSFPTHADCMGLAQIVEKSSVLYDSNLLLMLSFRTCLVYYIVNQSCPGPQPGAAPPHNCPRRTKPSPPTIVASPLVPHPIERSSILLPTPEIRPSSGLAIPYVTTAQACTRVPYLGRIWLAQSLSRTAGS